MLETRTTAPSRRADRRRADLVERLIDLFMAEGFDHFSLADLAERLHCSKSTLYTVAPSKEQIVTTALRAYFRRASERIEARLSDADAPVERLQRYLLGISEELGPASPAFFIDLDRFAPGREIYRENTRIAAERVRELVVAARGGARSVNAAFVGVVAGLVMEAINRGTVEAGTGLGDAEAYRALADLIVSGGA